jgi:hypothetical protein
LALLEVLNVSGDAAAEAVASPKSASPAQIAAFSIRKT